MTNRVTWRLAAVAAALLLTAGAAEASVQARTVVGWLGAGDWQLREHDDEVYLAEAAYEEGDVMPHTSWTVSNPTIETSRGHLLAYDAKGRDPKARLVKEAGKGDSTRWAFEEVSSISPKPRRSNCTIQEGPSGMTFRVRAKEGPYKGWYLAAKEGKGGNKALVLVRAKKGATVFKYIEKHSHVRP
jgi:hypothetical protein